MEVRDINQNAKCTVAEDDLQHYGDAIDTADAAVAGVA